MRRIFPCRDASEVLYSTVQYCTVQNNLPDTSSFPLALIAQFWYPLSVLLLVPLLSRFTSLSSTILSRILAKTSFHIFHFLTDVLVVRAVAQLFRYRDLYPGYFFKTAVHRIVVRLVQDVRHDFKQRPDYPPPRPSFCMGRSR